MRLGKVTIRNYRLHRELALDLDSDCTVIGGPNESGKSTLVEAIHRALFCRYKVGGRTKDEMRSGSGDPEVDLEFTVDGAPYRIWKRFAGHSGNAQLFRPNGLPTLKNDAAEEELAALLKTAGPAGGKGAGSQLDAQWAHLWAWQGSALDDPSDAMNGQVGSLIERLQQDGGAALVQSPLDSKIASHFEERFAQTYLTNGAPKKSSELQQAIDACADAKVRLQDAERTLARSHDALASLEEAEAAIRDAEVDAAECRSALATVRVTLGKAHDVSARLEVVRIEAVQRAAELGALQHVEARVAEVRGEIAALREQLEPLDAELQARHEHEQRTQRQLAEEETELASVRDARLKAQQSVNLARAHRDLLAVQRSLRDLTARGEAIESARREASEAESQLAELPPVSTEIVEGIADAERQRDIAESTLRAMATTIDVVAADRPVVVAGNALASGAQRVVVDAALIEVGGATIRITPGGGASLVKCRQERDDAMATLERLLAGLRVESSLEARALLTKREHCERLMAQHRQQLVDLQAHSFDARRADLGRAEQARRVEIDALIAGSGASALPSSEGDAEQHLVACQGELDGAEAREQKLIALRADGTKGLEDAQQALEELRRRRGELQTATATKTGQLQQLLDGKEDDAARMAAIARVERAVADLQLQEAQVGEELDALDPQAQELRERQYEKALQNHQQRANDAQTKSALARQALEQDGAKDIHGELALARSHWQRAEERRALTQRRTDAMARVCDLFRKEKAELAERFTAPLEARIATYLEALFGRHARVHLELHDDAFAEPRLARGKGAVQPFAFEVLSGGTREQVSAAVRLGMADVLAEQHHGALPVVLDDAFAYSDLERIEGVQGMLHLAAERGLQVILLTCNPRDFAKLGGRLITLSSRLDAVPRAPGSMKDQSPASRPKPVMARAAIDARTEDADEAEPEDDGLIWEDDAEDGVGLGAVAAAPRSGDEGSDDNFFIARLTARGGKLGSLSLLNELGWNADRFDRVKRALIAQNRIRIGRGRGGSVMLTDSLNDSD